MFKQLAYKLLCIFCFGLSQTSAKTNDKIDSNKMKIGVISKKNSKDGKITIQGQELFKVMMSKMQNITEAPSQEALQKILSDSKTELASLYALYLANKDTLLKDSAFLQKLMFSAAVLTREHLTNKVIERDSITMKEVSQKYDELLAKAPAPSKYRIKVAFFSNSEQASRAIKALTSNTPFEQIIKGSNSANVYPTGSVTEGQADQFITLFSNNIPNEIKTTVSQFNKIGVIPNPISVVGKDNKTDYWVVVIEDMRAGSKKDLPAFDGKDENLVKRLKSIIAAEQVQKLSMEALKNAEYTFFKPDGTVDTTPLSI